MGKTLFLEKILWTENTTTTTCRHVRVIHWGGWCDAGATFDILMSSADFHIFNASCNVRIHMKPTDDPARNSNKNFCLRVWWVCVCVWGKHVLRFNIFSWIQLFLLFRWGLLYIRLISEFTVDELRPALNFGLVKLLSLGSVQKKSKEISQVLRLKHSRRRKSFHSVKWFSQKLSQPSSKCRWEFISNFN